ncbi:hypothetical protein [Curtobacterium sp. MCBD17_013]|uniref:hypothetical protein n=1 Tax=Curtobacterium sp. MCBD17_013 TaxID=2175668 RepID=UPI0011B7A621|nr:hypothetical protein [Curtobacterium sp. MCBD17_013]
MLESEPDYTLRWPRDLFFWEATQLLKSPSTLALSLPVLLEEAFEETGPRELFDRSMWTTRNVFDTPATGPDPERWLRELLESKNKLQEREAPAYWANRHGLTDEAPNLHISLSAAFLELLAEFRTHGYFPRVYPKECPDQYEDSVDAAVEQHLRRATGIRFDWPIPYEQRDTYPEHLLYTLIEYFHDQAQRPRAFGFIHDFNKCGPHYDEGANKQSGGAVYRWRINDLLREHNVPLELSRNRGERGRLVRRFPSELAAGVNETLTRHQSPDDEVAHAIRDYRTRSAGRPQKIASVTLLAGEIEKRKLTIRQQLLKNDESALFRIANEFSIRHRNEKQRADYSDEFLDWVFHIYVATIALADAIDGRSAADQGARTPGPIENDR